MEYWNKTICESKGIDYKNCICKRCNHRLIKDNWDNYWCPDCHKDDIKHPIKAKIVD